MISVPADHRTGSMTTGARRGDIALRRNDAHYEALLALLRRGGMRVETTLGLIDQIADFSMFHHAGRFADGAIENLALEIGADLDKHLRHKAPACGSLIIPIRDQAGTRNVLHVTTFAPADRWALADHQELDH